MNVKEVTGRQLKRQRACNQKSLLIDTNVMQWVHLKENEHEALQNNTCTPQTTKTHLILVYIYVCNRNIKIIIHKMKKKMTSENKHFFTF